MRKLKKTCKKAKGLKIRLEKEKFLDRLKNPQKYTSSGPSSDEAAKILKRIRMRNEQASSTSRTIANIRRMAGLE